MERTNGSQIRPEHFRTEEKKLEFGQVLLNRDNPKSITVINSSPVKITVVLSTANRGSFIILMNSEIQVEAKSKKKVNFICNPRKSGRFTDWLLLSVKGGGPDWKVPISGRAR